MSIIRVVERDMYEFLSKLSWDEVETSLRDYYETAVSLIERRLPQIPFVPDGDEVLRSITLYISISRVALAFQKTHVVVEGMYVMHGFRHAKLSFDWGHPLYFKLTQPLTSSTLT